MSPDTPDTTVPFVTLGNAEGLLRGELKGLKNDHFVVACCGLRGALRGQAGSVALRRGGFCSAKRSLLRSQQFLSCLVRSSVVLV